jgi:hypothetical protein
MPPNEKELLYKTVEHLRWLTMVWDLEKLSANSIPSISEKRHLLLAKSCCKYSGLANCQKETIKRSQGTSGVGCPVTRTLK